ncbi:MAG: DsbA family protein [Candidatus Pacebacteria bacterium]|nr:DsbA family protein [Candidatus Paceibacterota bacterium]
MEEQNFGSFGSGSSGGGFNSPERPKNNLAVPMAIIIAGALIAGAVIFSNGKLSKKEYGGEKEAARGGEEETIRGLDAIKPVTSKDHIKGSPNATVKVVEYSDTECPFCKKFHQTMNAIMNDEEYGKSGEVAWVYRHFPIDQLHSKARKEAEAAECAGELGGNTAFWAYLDRIFEITPSNDGLDPARLPEIADYLELDNAEFNKCLNSGKYAKRVADDLAGGADIGVRGTPFSVVIAKDGRKTTINGAQPYAEVKSIIDAALSGK